jgi:hypothetical protein
VDLISVRRCAGDNGKRRTPRLVDADIGWAARPFQSLPNLEFRIGSRKNDNVRANLLRGQAYCAVRVLFDGAR